MNNEIITLLLNKEQQRQLSSIVGDASMHERANVIFICTAAPGDHGGWRLQVKKFPVSVLKKLAKLLAV
jgi:hypothetical protein